MSSGNGVVGQGPKRPKRWRELKFTDKVFVVGLGTVVIVIVYWISNVLLSSYVNRAFHNPQQCTIEFAAAGESRTRSYSSSRYVVVRTSECGDMRFVGNRNGLTRTEVANRIDALAGERVTVEVGVWQLPFSDVEIVGIEGLDLENQ